MSIYIISPEASQDLDEIYSYISHYSFDAATRFVDAFDRKCETVANFPGIGKIYEDLSPQLRGIILDKYIIFYRPVETDVEIIRVVSGYRNLEEIFSESDEG